MIVALIVSIATIVLVFVTIVLVALVVDAIVAIMMPAVQVTAASDREISCLLLLRLLLLLEHVEDTGHFVSSLTLLKKATS